MTKSTRKSGNKEKSKSKSKSKSVKRVKSEHKFYLSHNADDVKLMDGEIEGTKMKQKVKRRGRTRPKEHSGEKSRSRKGAKGGIKSIRRRPRPLMTRLVAELATKEHSAYRTRFQITDECLHRPVALPYEWIGPETDFSLATPRIRRTPSDDSLVGKSIIYPGEKARELSSKPKSELTQTETESDPTLDAILIEFHRLTVGDSRLFQVQ